MVMDQYPSETKIILELKNSGPLSLKELSDRIGISKMAILNHIKKLETKGLVKRSLVKTSIGRPYYVFKTSEESKENIASANDWVLEELIRYLDKTGNAKIATEFLKERYEQVRIDYDKKMSNIKPEQRVEALAKLREQENYYPELKSTGNDNYELLEYNCPIYKIAKTFGVACSLETRLFESVLDMDVSSTHRQVNGSDVCRFIIRKKGEK